MPGESATTMREKKEDWDGDETELKRQRVEKSSAPNTHAFENPLLPLAAYDDDEEEEKKLHGGVEYEDEADDEEDLIRQSAQGRRNRQVEVRRDCPYLDTVNRQCIASVWCLSDPLLDACCYQLQSSALPTELSREEDAPVNAKGILFVILRKLLDSSTQNPDACHSSSCRAHGRGQ